MSSFFKKKNFQEKYRVFGSAFFESPNNGFNLEKSDKLVLPSNALQKLTEIGLDFPMTLRVTPISTEVSIKNENDKDKNNKDEEKEKNVKTIDLTKRNFDFNDTQGRSLILSNVVDFTAPDGLILMSNWMLKRLGLNETGANVVELEAVCKYDKNSKQKKSHSIVKLKEYPRLEYVELQPFNVELLQCNDMASLVRKTLNMFYSSLRKEDIIIVEYNNKKYKLQVKTIRGKYAEYIPEVVIIDDTTDYQIGFSKAKDYEMQMKKEENDDNNDNNNNNNILDDIDAASASSSDDDWQVIKVGPIKDAASEMQSELSELEHDTSYAKIPSLVKDDEKENQCEKQGKNEKIKENDDSDKNGNDDVDVTVPSKVNDDSSDIAVNQGNGKANAELSWKCPKCEAMNLVENHLFCPNCGFARKDILKYKMIEKAKEEAKEKEKGKEKEKEMEKEMEKEKAAKQVNMDNSLQVVNILNPNKYEPGESRVTGWELKNVTDNVVTVSSKLSQISGDGKNLGLIVTYETPFEINVKPNEHVFFVIDVKAPGIAGKFEQVYELRDNNNFHCILCKSLPITYEVNRVHSAKNEAKIKEMYFMGFTDRPKVQQALLKHKWNVQQAINDLVADE